MLEEISPGSPYVGSAHNEDTFREVACWQYSEGESKNGLPEVVVRV
jgi:hypothetical protein